MDNFEQTQQQLAKQFETKKEPININGHFVGSSYIHSIKKRIVHKMGTTPQMANDAVRVAINEHNMKSV